MPRYQKVIWHHDLSTEPVLIYHEIGDDGYETRKVELYRDGRRHRADHSSSSGTTFLADVPIPPLEVIGADPEFTPLVIDADEFESVWRSARRSDQAGGAG